MSEVVVKIHLRSPFSILQKGTTAVDGMGWVVRSMGCILVLEVIRISEGDPWKGTLGAEECDGIDALLCYISDCDERELGDYQGAV